MMDVSLPPLIPTADGRRVPLALATRAQVQRFTEVAEAQATKYTQEHAQARATAEQYRRTLAYFRPHDFADVKLSTALARRGDGSQVVAHDQTKIEIERNLAALGKSASHAAAEVEAINGWIVAGRAALSLWHADDALRLTYAQALARHSTAQQAAPVVNVAAPQVDVHVPERGPQAITATRQPDGSLRAEVRSLPA